MLRSTSMRPQAWTGANQPRRHPPQRRASRAMAASSSAVSRTPRAAQFSSRCAREEVPEWAASPATGPAARPRRSGPVKPRGNWPPHQGRHGTSRKSPQPMGKRAGRRCPELCRNPAPPPAPPRRHGLAIPQEALRDAQRALLEARILPRAVQVESAAFVIRSSCGPGLTLSRRAKRRSLPSLTATTLQKVGVRVWGRTIARRASTLREVMWAT